MAGKRNARRGGKSDATNSGGLDPTFMKSLVEKIPANSATGRVDMDDIVRYMSQYPSEAEELLAQMGNLEIGNRNVDLSEYDFASLTGTIKHESFWVVQLENMGMVDPSGRDVDPSKVNTTRGAQPSFMIYCYDDKGTYRMTRQCCGLPDSETVLQAIRTAIATPMAPLKPCLPWFLMLSIKFEQHMAYLRPFLDSLPPPFHWRFETSEEAEAVNEGVYAKNEFGVKQGLDFGAKMKAIGNAAFARKDRAGALKAYSDAIEHLLDALSQKPDDSDTKNAKKQLAICYANRAATHLIAGKEMDPGKALVDGKTAEATDPNYAKAYIRQATAHQALGELADAQDVIARALRCPALENDIGLVDRLIELQTNGQGLSNDEAVFKNWLSDIVKNDQASSKRMVGVKGEWRRRCDAHLARWI